MHGVLNQWCNVPQLVWFNVPQLECPEILNYYTWQRASNIIAKTLQLSNIKKTCSIDLFNVIAHCANMKKHITSQINVSKIYKCYWKQIVIIKSATVNTNVLQLTWQLEYKHRYLIIQDTRIRDNK